MKVLVIPDVHLKGWMFERAAEILQSGAAEKAVCLMDIPDEWNQQWNLDLYEQTFDKAIWFQNKFPDTLWSYGNHDLSYVWEQPESGFSPHAVSTVKRKLSELVSALPDEGQMKYIHQIDNVLFLHGGLTYPFAMYYARGADYEDTEMVVRMINRLDCYEMWHEASPIWYRPQFYNEKMYRSEDILQVVGHTPVEYLKREFNVLSCDVFSTYRNGTPIGTQEFLVIDTETWGFEGIK